MSHKGLITEACLCHRIKKKVIATLSHNFVRPFFSLSLYLTIDLFFSELQDLKRKVRIVRYKLKFQRKKSEMNKLQLQIYIHTYLFILLVVTNIHTLIDQIW